MEKLKTLSFQYIEKDTSIRKMESGFLSCVLSLCLSLLKFIISVKLAHHLTSNPLAGPELKYRNKGKRARQYLSLFGLMEFSRPSYYNKARGLVYPLDEALDFPPDLWSYNIQELVGSNASETNFRESVRLMNGLLDLNLSSSGSERGIARLGSCVEAYYAEKEVERPTGPVHFSASFDGKGVPKKKPGQAGAVTEPARLGKGEKRGTKQMATVGVMSWFEPKERTVAGVLRGLMGQAEENAEQKREPPETVEKNNDNRWHQDIHRRAFLADQDKCIDYGLRYLKKRIAHPDSRFVVPVDAGIGLEDRVLHYVAKHGLTAHFDGIILDIIHVSEYVWTCANAVLGGKSSLRTAWVRDVLTDLLNSRTSKVIADLKLIVTKGDLTDGKKRAIEKTVTYFENHRHKMDYKSYLDKGYPISSALVESNCRHLVKDRMEQSGMRWSSKGAQNMMDVRAVKLNGDLVDFMDYVERKNRKIAA